MKTTSRQPARLDVLAFVLSLVSYPAGQPNVVELNVRALAKDIAAERGRQEKPQ